MKPITGIFYMIVMATVAHADVMQTIGQTPNMKYVNPAERSVPLIGQDSIQRVLRVTQPANARVAPSIDAMITGVLRYDELYVADRNEWGWYRLKHANGNVWCYGRFLVELIMPTETDMNHPTTTVPEITQPTPAPAPRVPELEDTAQSAATADTAEKYPPDTIFYADAANLTNRTPDDRTDSHPRFEEKQQKQLSRIPSIMAGIAAKQMGFWPGVALQIGVELIQTDKKSRSFTTSKHQLPKN